MNVEDEVHNFPDLSGDVIRRYCTDAREMIIRAGSREEAVTVKRALCSRLAAACESSLVMQATVAYVDELIEKTWTST